MYCAISEKYAPFFLFSANHLTIFLLSSTQSGIIICLTITPERIVFSLEKVTGFALIIYSNVATTKRSAQTFQNDEETRLSSILSSVEGAGEVETMITKSSGQVVGVLVIADGANNPLVRLRLLQAASSALGVDSEIVSVMSRTK